MTHASKELREYVRVLRQTLVVFTYTVTVSYILLAVLFAKTHDSVVAVILLSLTCIFLLMYTTLSHHILCNREKNLFTHPLLQLPDESAVDTEYMIPPN